MTPPTHSPDMNTPYHQISLQVAEQRAQAIALADRIARVEGQINAIIVTVRQDIKENYSEIKDAMKTHSQDMKVFQADIYNKINKLTLTDAASAGARAYSWKLIAAFGGVATVAMGVGSFIWFIAKHIPT